MKPHLLKVAEPILEGQDYTCACGTEVKEARFAFRMDWDELVCFETEASPDAIKLSAITNCKHCIEKLLRESWGDGRYYVYGLVQGEDSGVVPLNLCLA